MLVSRLHIIFISLLFAAILLVGGCNMAQQSAVAQPPAQVSTPPPDITCEQLVTLAETSVGLVCDGIGRNQACYGNHLVSVEFQANSTNTFVQSGDKINLLTIKRLSTSPLNLVTHDWGIAVIKAQANLPDSLPGQNVTFLMYGDTTIDNPTQDMHAVTVSTRIGNTNCTDIPDSAVLIQSPSGSEVAMNINGTDMTLGSTAFLTAQQGQDMEFAIIEGQGKVTANGVTQIVNPGAQVGIPLGGADGLHASGPPSAPVPFDVKAIQVAPLRLLDRPVVVPPPIVAGQSNPAPTDTDTPTPIGQVQVQATACVPRSDWTYIYTVQRGDNLSAIALKANLRTADLQAGNCIANPNQLIAGQTLRVPRPVPTNTPRPTATFTPEPATATPAGMTGPNLRADSTQVDQGGCTVIHWDVDNIKSVFFEGQGVKGHDSRKVCPQEMTTYTLLVNDLDGQRHPFQITINVVAAPTDTPTEYIIY